MGKRRMINTDLFTDEHFGKLSDKAKILFIACFTHADDDGKLSANLANLRAMAFRFDDIALGDIKVLLEEIKAKMLNFKHYSVRDCDYIQLQKWKEYQTIQKDRYTPSKIPFGNKMETKCVQDDTIGKVRLDKVRKDKNKEADSIIQCFNQTTNSKCKLVDSNREPINARLNEGYTLEDCKEVIAKKHKEWKNDPEMSKYITIETLFRKSKFDKYLNQKEVISEGEKDAEINRKIFRK